MHLYQTQNCPHKNDMGYLPLGSWTQCEFTNQKGQREAVHAVSPATFGHASHSHY